MVQCTMAAMKARGLSPDPDVAHKVAKGIQYSSKYDKVFSITGCKTIAQPGILYISSHCA